MLTSASPASTSADSTPHENGRDYVLTELPAEIAAPIRRWLCPANRRLRRLLAANRLAQGDGEAIGWLREAIDECDGGRRGGRPK